MPPFAYTPNPAPLTQEELDALAAKQAAMGGSVPEGGYQVQPAPTSPPPAAYGPPPDQGYATQTTAYAPVDPAPASTYYGGPAPVEQYYASPQNNPAAVETSYPASGTVMTTSGSETGLAYPQPQQADTVRSIPPPGSTYPAAEFPRATYDPIAQAAARDPSLRNLLWQMEQARRARESGLQGLFGSGRPSTVPVAPGTPSTDIPMQPF